MDLDRRLARVDVVRSHRGRFVDGRRRMIGAMAMITVALALAGEAAAKEFDRLVVVGDQGRWIALEPRSGVIDLLFEGSGGERPARGGYLRLFPLFRGFPGLPSR